MKTKFMAVILTAFMMMCASACANSEKTDKPEKAEKAESTASSTVETQSTASTVSMPDPVPVPEDGWTYKDVIETVTVDGKTLKEGFTADDLGDGYEIQIDTQDEDECCFYFVKNGEYYYYFYTNDASNLNNLGKAKVDYFTTAYGEDDDRNNIDPLIEKYSGVSFNGVKIGDTCDDIIAAYGQPDDQRDTLVVYKDKESDRNILAFSLNDNGQIYLMFVFDNDNH